MEPKSKDIVSDNMQALRQSYIQDLDDHQELLAGLVQRLKTGDLNGLENGALQDLSHKLTGTGTTYGFPRISAAARHIESLLTTRAWTPEALLLLSGTAGMSQREYRAMAGLVHKMATLCDTLGMKPLGDAATHFEEMLDKKTYVPRQTLIWHIKALMEACCAARTDKPVSFQRIDKAVEPNLAPYAVLSENARQRPLVLIVDDDAAVCSLLSRSLAGAGFIAQVAWDGRLAIDIMLQKSPDLVLLDYTLPGIDGAEVLRTMRENPALASTPVVFLLARKQLMETLGEAANDISGYITKPFNPDGVIEHCSKVLENRSA